MTKPAYQELTIGPEADLWARLKDQGKLNFGESSIEIYEEPKWDCIGVRVVNQEGEIVRDIISITNGVVVGDSRYLYVADGVFGYTRWLSGCYDGNYNFKDSLFYYKGSNLEDTPYKWNSESGNFERAIKGRGLVPVDSPDLRVQNLGELYPDIPEVEEDLLLKGFLQFIRQDT